MPARNTIRSRDDLFVALDEALARVVRNNRSAVLNVVGRNGIGKSTMVDVWLEARRDERVVRSWIPHEPATTFRPIGDVVEKCLGIDAGDDLDQVRARLEKMPELDELVRRRLAHVSGGDEESFPNHEIFWALRFLLGTAAAGRPLIVVWDGINRAEPTFLDMLEYLPGHRGAVLILCVANETVLKARPHWQMGLEEPGVESIVLETTDDFAGAIDEDKQRDAVDIEVLFTASFLGEAFSLSALTAIGSSRTSDEIKESIDRLVGEGVLRMITDGVQDVIAFRHGGTRERIYESMDDMAAGELHERVGDYWEGLGGAGRRSFDELSAFHLEMAAELDRRRPRDELVRRAVRRLASSGRRALARSDAPAAADLLERAIFLMPEADERRVTLLLDLCDALLDLGEMQRISRIAQAGLDEAIDSKDHTVAHRFEIWKRVVAARLQQGRDVKNGLGDEEIAAALERAGDNRGAAEAQVLVAERRWEEFDYESAVDTLEQALFNARAGGNRRLQSKIGAWLLFSFFWGSMPAGEGEERASSMPFDFSRDRLLEANRLTTLGGVQGLRGRFAVAQDNLLAARTLQEELGQPLVISFNPQIAGTIALLAGDAAQAEADFRLGFEEAQHVADPGHAASTGALLAKALYEQGRYDEAMRYTRLAEQASFGAPEMIHGEWKTTRAKLSAREGEVDEAISVIQRVVDLYPPTAVPRDRADALMDLADVYALGGRDEEERQALVEAMKLYEAKGVVPAVERIKGRLGDG